MSLPIIVRPEAELDLREAADWYECQQPRLGERFLDQVSAALDRIAERPGLHPVIWEDVRSCRLRRFPYLVYYRVLPDQVQVLAVLHGSRDSATWRERT